MSEMGEEERKTRRKKIELIFCSFEHAILSINFMAHLFETRQKKKYRSGVKNLSKAFFLFIRMKNEASLIA